MSILSNLDFAKGRPIGKVTWLPAILLVFQGRWDALRSKRERSVPDARIDRLISKCSILKEREVLAAESLCKDAREQGIRACNTLSEATDGDVSTRRTATEYAKSRLLKVGPFLTENDLILRTRIEKTNDEALAKIMAYVKGVRLRDADYVAKIALSDSAYEAYVQRHAAEDKVIHAAVRKLLPKDEEGKELISSAS